MASFKTKTRPTAETYLELLKKSDSNLNKYSGGVLKGELPKELSATLDRIEANIRRGPMLICNGVVTYL